MQGYNKKGCLIPNNRYYTNYSTFDILQELNVQYKWISEIKY